MQHLGDLDHRSRICEVPLVANLDLTPRPTIENPTHFFLTFHDGRHGWFVPDNGVHEERPVDGKETETEFEAFAQRWLYFEVLRAILNVDPQRPEGFDRTEADGRHWVDSSSLPEKIEQWYTYEMDNENGRALRLIRAEQVLETARHFVSNYCAASGPGLKQNTMWALDPRISLSFMVLGQTLSRVLARILRDTNLRIEGWTSFEFGNQGWGYSGALFDALIKDGWCRKTLYMLQGLMRRDTLGFLNALKIYPPHPHGSSHSQCSALHCKVEADQQHKLFHACDETDPSCHPIGPKTDELNKWVLQKKIPLLHYKKESGCIDVIPMDTSFRKSYIVFSHIWMDGFGNPASNELNKCVLDYFVDLFHKLGVPDTYFWIDTLSVPILKEYEHGCNNREAIRAAIETMQSIYAHADHTIILDRSMMMVELGPGYQAPAMTITVSQWMTRLWTLQEAVFSKSIQFAFKGRQLMSMDQLEMLYPPADREHHNGRAAASRAYYHGILGRERRRIVAPDAEPVDHEIGPGFVAQVWKAAQWRTVRYSQHETLALALLLKVDVSHFADTSNTTHEAKYKRQDFEKLMRILLTHLALRDPCAIPPGMIFLPGQRLNVKGFGWAPITWLSRHEVDAPDPLEIATEPAKLSLGHGLEVKFPGFRLLDMAGSLNRSREPLGIMDDFHFSIDRYQLEWYRVVPAGSDEHFPDAEAIGGRELAIILPHFPLLAPREIALLVTVDGPPHGRMLNVLIQCRVWISRVTNADDIWKWRDEFGQHSTGVDLCGELLPKGQPWCVDSIQHVLPRALGDVPDESPPPAPLSRTRKVISSSWKKFATFRSK